MEVTIRAAREGEEGRLTAMYEWLFAPPGSRPEAWDERRAAVALREAIRSHDAVVLVAEAEETRPSAAPAAPGRTRAELGSPVADAPWEEAGGTLVGLCTAYQDLHSVRFGYRAWVEDLAVDPARRSRGIGARLLAAARDWARERGATHLELDSAEARADAHRFYEREGAQYRSITFGWEL